nr:protein argonaute-2-like [Lepeophtheirus salmonis]
MQSKTVSANLFSLNFSKTTTVYNHTIKATPELKVRIAYDFVTRVLRQRNEKIFKNFAFDGARTLILFEKIAPGSEDSKFTITAGKKEFVFEIIFNEELKIGKGMEQLITAKKGDKEIERIKSLTSQALDLLLRPIKEPDFVKAGRGVLISGEIQNGTRDLLPIPISNNVEIWQGLLQSVKFLSKGIFLNSDVFLGAYYQTAPLDRFLGRYADKKSFMNLEKLLKRVKLQTTHLKKNFSFKGMKLSEKSSKDLFFEAEGGKISVADYFQKTYKPLRNPDWPCVVRMKNDMEMYFPIEILSVGKNQRVLGKLDEKQTSDMIKISARRPHERFEMIKKRMDMFSSYQNTEILGLEIDKGFAQVKAKVLNAPELLFANKKRISVNDGGWNLNGVSAIRPILIKDFSVINCTPMRDFEIKRQMNTFINSCKNFGIQFSNENYTLRNVRKPAEIKDGLMKFSLIILPNSFNGDYYKFAKTASELYKNTITQSVRERNFARMSPSLAANIALKIVVKFGGFSHFINSGLNIFNVPTIVFGADVSHPGVGSNVYTMSAVVASMDRHCSSFNTYMERQEDRQEIITNLKEIVRKALNAFKTKNNCVPQKIIFFRDEIKNACTSLDPKYNPSVTYIVAQKRHSVRFNNNTSGNYNGKPVNSNISPGTLISELSSSEYNDFYMVTHKALLGTARPVRYLTIKDENDFKDNMPKFIYQICHLYGRATKSVSIPSPIYYAHLAAARTKVYSDCEEKELVNDKENMFYL